MEEIPFPDDTFDVVMSGHVVGDDYDGEIAELTRVCRAGGWLLDCPGDSERNITPNDELTRRGWEGIHYIGSFGKDVFLYGVIQRFELDILVLLHEAGRIGLLEHPQELIDCNIHILVRCF